MKCRFDFPKIIIIDNILSVYLDEDDNIIDMSFEPERNDKYSNKYNPLSTFVWRANTDLSACLSP